MSKRSPLDRARRRLPWPRRRPPERLGRRLDRAAYRLNPYLLAVAIGLAVLNLTFFVALKVTPTGPRPGTHMSAAGTGR